MPSLPRLAFLANYIELIARQPTDQFELWSRLRSEFITERSQLCVVRKIHPGEKLTRRLVIVVLQVVVLLGLTPSASCPLNLKPSEIEKEGIPTRAKLKRSER